MSVRTTCSVGSIDPKILVAGIKKYFKETLVAQGLAKENCVVSLTEGGGVVRMHGAEKANANYGVVSFSDTEYQIGINRAENGDVSFVYDSWVGGGQLRKRVDGAGAANKAANLVQCELLERARKHAALKGRAFGVEFLKEGGARAFVPNS